MKLFIVGLLIASFSCQSTNKAKAVKTTSPTILLVTDSVPACIKQLIEKMKSDRVTNPPSKIFSYTFKNKKVFYVPAVCCDMFSDLYNDSCKIMGHPDGGFTGRGDGNFKDFDAAKTNEKLLWEDTRK